MILMMMMMMKMMVTLMMIIISPASLAENVIKNKSELLNLKILDEMFPTLFIGSLAAFNSGHARGSYL